MKKFKISIIVMFILITICSFLTNTVYAANNPETIDGIMQGADGFLDKGKNQFKMDEEQFKETSNVIYNLLLGIAMIIAVSVGIVLGIQYVMGSIEKKAEIKESLLGYAISCAVVFGAFGIWRLVIFIFKI